MGIVMRTYVFICLVGIISTIGIVLMTYTYKNVHKIQSSEADRITVWREHRKPYAQKHRAGIMSDINGSDQTTSRQIEKNNDENDDDDDDHFFSVKLFSDSGHRTNRNTASIKDDIKLTVSDNFSLLEPSNSGRHPRTSNSNSKEAGPTAAAAALLINIQKEDMDVNEPSFRKHNRSTAAEVTLGRKSTATNDLKLRDKIAARDRLITKSQKLVPTRKEKLITAVKQIPSEKTLPKDKGAGSLEKTRFEKARTGTQTVPKVPLYNPPVIGGPKTKDSRGVEGQLNHHIKPPATRRQSAFITRNRTVVKSQANTAKEIAAKMRPQLQIKPVAINQNILAGGSGSYPLYSKHNTTLTRVLAAGDLKPGKCRPHNNVAMLKTHKCSSSTLQNILFRWGDDHNLTFVLPKDGPYIGHPQPFDINLALRVVGDKYNIIANHARYNREGLTKVMPRDTVYITVLRDPVKQFESAFTYYKYDERYGVPGLRSFLRQPEIYFQQEPVYPRQAGRNQMLYDLGLDARFMDSTSPDVREYISMIENNFQLVLIAEYFDESLILLKDLLCWSLEDIVYFNQNVRSQSSVRNVTPNMRRAILDWNSADVALYNHFNRTLRGKIESFGVERMKGEVAQLQVLNEVLKRKCIGGKLESHDPRMWYPAGIKVDSFVMNPNARGERLCEQLIRPELSYIDILKAKQRPVAVRRDPREELIRRQMQVKNVHSRRFVRRRLDRFG